MAPVTRSKAVVLQEEVAAASSSSDEPCSSSTLAHNAAVKASRNVPLRQRKRGVAEQAIKAAWHHNQEFHSLPDYLKDNEYIQRFYRRPGLPLRKTLWSLFGIHNETGNIWSHLIGAPC